MRRKDLEIRDRDILSGMLDLAEILHLAIKNEPFPYVVPLNFGYEWEGDTLVFYFHCAKEGLKHNVPQGTYFVMVDISEFLALPRFRGFTDLEFCEWMIKNVGVAAVPGSSFFRENVNHLIRLHFARSAETLDEAITRLAKLASLLK